MHSGQRFANASSSRSLRSFFAKDRADRENPDDTAKEVARKKRHGRVEEVVKCEILLMLGT